ncbi:hypothetical protein BESB_026150 [Besnoitia besnoiti]|uniref:Uncharacterized protein n=1 Tax=Besnoitia besnoiti TaxID=94643 RepID=A0A2A9M5Q4_BESBE|nr:uncharacterized protein BESB_026150 [Besnoitia besnoiti]PFH31641.1 hypothetical protein BESB_026150 [Besnoitia besnoiti]
MRELTSDDSTGNTLAHRRSPGIRAGIPISFLSLHEKGSEEKDDEAGSHAANRPKQVEGSHEGMPAAAEGEEGQSHAASEEAPRQGASSVEEQHGADEQPQNRPEDDKESDEDSGSVSRKDDTVTGEGKTPAELTEEDFKEMTSSQGLAILLGQGKGMVREVQETLDGVNAVASITQLMGQVREDIRKDVEALNRTITEEYQNIEQLRQLQEAQTAVLRSQLSYLIPLKRSEVPSQPEVAEKEDEIPESSALVDFCNVLPVALMLLSPFFLNL